MFQTRNRKTKNVKQKPNAILDDYHSKKPYKWNAIYGVIICIVIIIGFIILINHGNVTNYVGEPLNDDIKDNNGLKKDSKQIGLDDTIFMGIPTLGDYACPDTIKSIYNNAKWPDNIYVGIYQQNDDKDPDCLEFINNCHKNNDTNIELACKYFKKGHIKINRTTVLDGAKGPVYGRYMSMKLYSNQKYIIMMDSHTLFREHWDLYLLSWYNNIDSDKRDYAVITHYPWGAESLERRTDKNSKKYRYEPYSYHICGTFIEGPPNYMPRNANGCFAKTNIDPKNELKYIPVRTPFFGGGFSFVKAIFWLEHVKWDPYMLYIFNGEEFGISTRGWTSGYDFYSPPFDLCAHWYDKGPKRKSPHISNPKINTHKIRDRSEKRINYMWGIWNVRYPNIDLTKMSDKEIANIVELRDLDKYGLGNKRTLKQYWEFAGIDIEKKNITVFKEKIYEHGGLKYVPWNK